MVIPDAQVIIDSKGRAEAPVTDQALIKKFLAGTFDRAVPEPEQQVSERYLCP
jgi:hypothetical protein